MTTPEQSPVAIIGMGCVLPGAPNVPAFWQSIDEGKKAPRKLSGPRWDWDKYGTDDPAAVDRTTSFLGASVDDFKFPWKQFRIPPAEMRTMHSMEMFLIDSAHQAMLHGGYGSERTFARDQVAIIVGTGGMGRKSNTSFNFKWRLPEILDSVQHSPSWATLTPQEQTTILSEIKKQFVEQYLDGSDDWAFWGFLSPTLGRIANLFDLQGPHFCVDAHAASGLVALETAMGGLANGEYSMALVGAVSPALSPMELVLHDKLRRLSATGAFPLDARADGTVLGEGAVMLLVKRLCDAERDGDEIHAVVRHVAGLNRGRGPALTATDDDNHYRAAKAALVQAAISPETIAYLETGATGAVSWDVPILNGLAKAYAVARHIALGAVAESVGDLQAASSFAALLEIVRALKTRKLPTVQSCQTPHPELKLEQTPFTINAGCSWPTRGPARAAVHSAGFGGSAYHAIVEEYQAPPPARRISVINAQKPVAEPIAVVGFACRYPGANSPEELWENTVQGRSAVIPMSNERWPVELYYDPAANFAVRTPEAMFRIYAPVAGLVNSPLFDFTTFGIPPAALTQMDITQQWCLQIAQEVLQNAGYGKVRAIPGDRTSVIVATCPGNQQEVKLDAQIAYSEFDSMYRRVLKDAGLYETRIEQLVEQTKARFLANSSPTNSHTLPGMLDCAPAARIARAFDLRGPTFTVESACASSLVAMSLAVSGLRQKRWDVAIVGGAWSQITVPYCVNTCYSGVISPSGHTSPFSSDADGFVHGEGCGMFVVKRLSDAKRDGDRIHALVLGTGGASDGRGRSIVASQQRGQELAIRRALKDAAINPSSVQYIETHGTGMQEGDISEAAALLALYGRKQNPPTISSLKPLLGHSYIASGAAALIRAIFALKYKTAPPLITGPTPNPDIPWQSRLRFHPHAEPLPKTNEPLRAAVNGYGFGGTTFHVILEEYTE